MTVTLANKYLSAQLHLKGAELKSLKEQSTNTEYIWQSDPAFWTGAAPILFPIIGGLKDNTYYFEGKPYNMPSHGFVRNKEWKVVETNAIKAIFSTTSDVETRMMYPWEFELRAIYELVNNSIKISYEVLNKSTNGMYFSIGSHPAFNLPFAGGYTEHYYVEFSEEEYLERYFFKNGLHLNKTEPIFDNCKQIYARKNLFDRGPIIFKNPKSREFTLRSSQKSKHIKVFTDDISHLALWAAPKAPFFCIEPWLGIPDNVDTDQNFPTKEGLINLAPETTFMTSYSISINS
ncbi:MAG: aldose 1-epimerase family protein [Deltaproteobacteria bacterium]|jgi:galactose mutarotase-like enzyme|nr:aldose 1-epimerase family protein [Deltaproteobacteria bacterium]